MIKLNHIYEGDTLTILKTFPAGCVDTIITSPPYWGLRDYGDETKVIWDADKNCEHNFIDEVNKHDNLRFRVGENTNIGNFKNPDIYSNNKVKTSFCSKCGAWYGQLGLEPTLDLYINHLLQITAELKRVLKKTGVMFWNHGDCYHSTPAGNKGNFNYGKDGLYQRLGKRHTQGGKAEVTPKKISGTPKCLAFQNYRLILRMIDEQGWILRNDIKWHKPNSMPSSVKDRFANTHEPIFMLTKSQKYWFDLDAVRIPHTTNENRPYGIVRERTFGYDTDYPEVRKKSSFNYRVRDAEKKSEQRPQFKASKTEIKKYKHLNILQTYDAYEGKYTDKIKTGNWKAGLPRAENIKGKNPGDLWTIPTQPFSQAHFATFPEKLIQPMIECACPKEICNKCGKARVRITEPTEEYAKNLGGKGFSKKDWNIKGSGSAKSNNYPSVTASYQTVGWTDCGCKAGFKPGIVLDPFGGAGTTGKVAKKLGRSYILIDIKPEYDEMSKKRLANTMGSLF